MVSTRSLRYRAYRPSQGRVHIARIEVSLDDLARKQPHYVVVRPRYAGICSADIRELRGERPGRTDFGHEVVGTVIDATHPRFSHGQPVALNPFVQIQRETAFAETMYLAGSSELLAAALLDVPSADPRYSIVEPLACVIHAARRCSMARREPRLVYGSGFFGCLLYCYLEINGQPVILANRSPDRLTGLLERMPDLRITRDPEACAGSFQSVFLMQARLSREDIVAAGRVVREAGEIVLFGAVDPGREPELYEARRQQKRVPSLQDGKQFYLQGTLDATLEDLREAIAILSRPEVSRMLAPLFAQPLTFEQGADHLNQRAAAPRSFDKYLIETGS